jgi:hypothetical protein
MMTNLPSFENKAIREEYSNIINNIFKNKNFDWTSVPAIVSPYVFVRPNSHEIPPQLNTETHPFLNIAKIGISTKEGIVYLSIISYPPMNSSYSKKILEWIGYEKEDIRGHPGLSLLAKPINLEHIVRELKYVNCILKKK